MSLNILIGLLLFIFPSENTNVISSPDFVGTTTTGIGYGRPTASCDGTGVCFVSETTITKMEDDFGNAELTFSRNGSISSIHAVAKSMSKKTIEKHFSGDYFIMKDPFKGVLKLKGESLKINIPTGKHRIKKTKTGFLIEIKK
jgi:hypothetical protein